MHRDGSGNKIPDIQAARATWKQAGRTVSTYPNKAEWDAWVEDKGELVTTLPNGVEVRQHATLKGHSRGGTRKIIHNCVIIGNPKRYAEWVKMLESLPNAEAKLAAGWMGEWTYYPAKDLEYATEVGAYQKYKN